MGLSEVFDWARRMKGKGLQVENRRIDRQELMRYKRSFTEPVPKSREEMFAKAGIEAFHGRARFAGTSTVHVGDDILEGRYVVLAAGRKPADLNIPGAEHLTTSEQFLELNALPKRILFIGGGYTESKRHRSSPLSIRLHPSVVAPLTTLPTYPINRSSE